VRPRLQVVQQMLLYCKNMKFEDEPDYDMLRTYIRNLYQGVEEDAKKKAEEKKQEEERQKAQDK